ncbi:hypothetical protein GCM10009839_24010 [Catenulispora yoronensis]|uniref:Uncharacterized protein n=1 Tax=Catenulispora yoronensis TaxID=450799 RepID=A0ABP5FHG3_9ACTN
MGYDGNYVPDPDANRPDQTLTVDSASATAGAGFSISVICGAPPRTGVMHDTAETPGTGQGIDGYSWNQAMTAMFGGCGDGSFGPPRHGTWADPLSMETAHFAILTIKQMLHSYANDVDGAKKQILENHWSGPAATAFGQVLDAFTTYVKDLADLMAYPPPTSSLLRIAHMNEAFCQAATFIWQCSLTRAFNDNGAHDRNTPVNISKDLTYTGTMVGAGRAMLKAYDSELKKLYEGSA